MALPILIGLLTGLLFFALAMEREPVARLEVPTVGPEAPTAGSQTDSNSDPGAASKVAIGATRVKTELTEEKAKHLRSEVGQIAQA